MCAWKDELRDSNERGEEATEMTAMTSTPTDGDEANAENNNLFTNSTERGKAYIRRMQSAKLICLSGALSTLLLTYMLAKVIMGSKYIDSCPADPFIPTYLIVSGCMLVIIIVVIFVVVYVRTKKKDNDTLNSSVYLVAFVYFFLHLVLHLAGSVCVIVKENHIKDLRQHNVTGDSVACSETLMDFSRGVVIFELVTIGLVFVVTALFIAEAIREVCCPKYSFDGPPASTSSGRSSTTAVVVNDSYAAPT